MGVGQIDAVLVGGFVAFDDLGKDAGGLGGGLAGAYQRLAQTAFQVDPVGLRLGRAAEIGHGLVRIAHGQHDVVQVGFVDHVYIGDRTGDFGVTAGFLTARQGHRSAKAERYKDGMAHFASSYCSNPLMASTEGGNPPRPPPAHQCEIIVSVRSIARIFHFGEREAQILANFGRLATIQPESDAENARRLGVFALFHQHHAEVVPGGRETFVLLDRAAQHLSAWPRRPSIRLADPPTADSTSTVVPCSAADRR